MAVTYDTVGPSATGAFTPGSTTLSWSHTCSGSGRLLTVGVAVGTASPSVTTTATYNSVSMTSAGRVMSNNANDGYVELFYLVAPATGSNTVQVTASVSKDMVAGSISFNGVDQTTPISNTTTNFGFDTTPTVNITSAVGNMVIDAMCTGNNVSSSSQTNRWLKNQNAISGAGNGAGSTASGAGSVTMSYTVTSDWWGIVGASINALATSTATSAWIVG